jgi:hypothetical protein
VGGLRDILQNGYWICCDLARCSICLSFGVLIQEFVVLLEVILSVIDIMMVPTAVSEATTATSLPDVCDVLNIWGSDLLWCAEEEVDSAAECPPRKESGKRSRSRQESPFKVFWTGAGTRLTISLVNFRESQVRK